MISVRLATAFTAALALSACTTFTTPRYAGNTDNLLALRAHRGASVALGSFTSTMEKKSEIMCRGAGPVTPADGLSFADYVKSALAQELAGAEMLSPQSPVTLSGEVNAELATVGSGQWQLAMKLKSSNGQSLAVVSKADFNAAWNGMQACNIAASQFVPAVQKLIAATVSSPDFARLVH